MLQVFTEDYKPKLSKQRGSGRAWGCEMACLRARTPRYYAAPLYQTPSGEGYVTEVGFNIDLETFKSTTPSRNKVKPEFDALNLPVSWLAVGPSKSPWANTMATARGGTAL